MSSAYEAFKQSSLVQHAKRMVLGNNGGLYLRDRAVSGVVNLEYSHKLNLGDTLSPVIVGWMLERKGLSLSTPVGTTKHLLALGSLLGRGVFDATVWGTGILETSTLSRLKHQKGVRTYDIRAVRGPKTREMLLKYGFPCPATYGDPAVLLPRMVSASLRRGPASSGPVGVIFHRTTDLSNMTLPSYCKRISIETADYRGFIEQLTSCSRIVSESLHGVILAEAFGVPARAFFVGTRVSSCLFKYEDWYASTARPQSTFAHSLEEVLDVPSLALPELDSMAKTLMDAFPYDLWNVRD